LAKKEEFDAMGQPVGAPRDETQGAEPSTLTPLVDVAPKPKAKAKAAAPDIKAQIREALKDPELAKEFVATASQDPGLRKILNLPADSVPPSGHYQRNYRSEPALRVYGGVEVEHEPGYEPLPPGYLTKFVAEDAETGKTDDPRLAKLDAAGKPVKTEEYKSHLDAKANGKRLGGNVRFDIEADQFTPGDVGVAV
jgi:hypothetical protein